MTGSRNPKVFARDIADGYVVVTPATCKRLPAEELKVLYRNLEVVARELRAEQVPLIDVQSVLRKNQRLQRTNTAMMFIRNHARRIRLIL